MILPAVAANCKSVLRTLIAGETSHLGKRKWAPTRKVSLWSSTVAGARKWVYELGLGRLLLVLPSVPRRWLTKTRSRSRTRAKVSEGGFFPSDKEMRRARPTKANAFPAREGLVAGARLLGAYPTRKTVRPHTSYNCLPLIYLLCVYSRVAPLLSVVLLLQFRCPASSRYLLCPRYPRLQR